VGLSPLEKSQEIPEKPEKPEKPAKIAAPNKTRKTFRFYPPVVLWESGPLGKRAFGKAGLA
jgi:hypothetical protein